MAPHSNPSRRLAVAVALSLALAGCDPAGLDLGFGAEPTGEVAVGVFLDRDGSRGATPFDTVYQGASVSLRPIAGGAPVATTTTDIQGIARFSQLRLGDYLVTVAPTSIGDSIQVSDVSPDSIRVTAVASQVPVTVRLAYPETSIRQARLLPPGRRVFVRGQILSGVQVFSDLSAHMNDTSVAIRMTGVALLGGLTGNSPGDSVVVVATTGQANGQPILTSATLTRVAARPAPVPKAITSGVAANAQNGALDADFVLVSSVVISDTATVGADFRVTASDGSGSVTILLDANIGFVTGGFRPARTMSVRGVLVPDGLGGWRLKPRGGGDVTFLN